jgi:hypothetical protein
MAKNDQEEAFERLLTTSLARVIDFVKFAEAKNAALLTFNSAWIVAGVTLLHGSASLAAHDWPTTFMIELPLSVIFV